MIFNILKDWSAYLTTIFMFLGTMKGGKLFVIYHFKGFKLFKCVQFTNCVKHFIWVNFGLLDGGI